ncbi:MAG TPA: hypothetical protein DCQ70_00325, partial [Halieaceae bacterium]|nr:hypothetical protein [Halieaceae bacterium]
MHAHVVVHFREYGETVAENAAHFVIRAVGDFVHCVFAALRVNLVETVEQVVPHIHHAVGVQQEIVHLREAIADGPLGHADLGKVRAPGTRFRYGLRLLAQCPQLALQVLGDCLMVLGGQPRAIAVHAREYGQPLLDGAFVAHEGRGLLVAERAVELKGLLQLGITAERELRQPDIGREAGDVLLRRHLLQHDGRTGRVGFGACAGIHEALRADANLPRTVGLRQRGNALCISEPGDGHRRRVGDTVGRVAIVAQVRRRRFKRAGGYHCRRHGRALAVDDPDVGSMADGSTQQHRHGRDYSDHYVSPFAQAHDSAHAGRAEVARGSALRGQFAVPGNERANWRYNSRHAGATILLRSVNNTGFLMATSSLRSRIHTSLASMAMVLLAACASAPPTPSVDYNAAYDFDAVKTVALYRAAETAPGEDPLKLSDMTRDRIESGLKSALTARGFTLVNSVEEADLLLSWHLVTEDKMDVRSYEVPSATTMGMYGPGFYRYNT